MKIKSTIVLKRVLGKGAPLSRVHLRTVVGDLPSRDLSLDSEGFIGKPVPFTPTFLGVFILNQYLSKNSKWGSLPWNRFLRGGFKS